MVKFFLKHCNFANKIRSFLIEAAFFFFEIIMFVTIMLQGQINYYTSV